MKKTTKELNRAVFDDAYAAGDRYCRTGPSLEQHSDFMNGFLSGHAWAYRKYVEGAVPDEKPAKERKAGPQ